ncbi:hypothetical protein BG74_04630 [Sodalis-like endosymbiont of Proechinophthirus fluctus]|nr:hypothetical protein BG74_04630 [Sodalis-like endosymbiont of Proechinophthirus fluctus]
MVSPAPNSASRIPLQPDDIRFAPVVVFIAHAVIGDESQHDTLLCQLAESLIKLPIEHYGLRFLPRSFMLDEIGQGKVHHIWAVVLQ